MNPDTGRGRVAKAKTPRGAATRQALVEAALRVFQQRGFAGATTREIAQTAGVTEGTIYRHFTDKHSLFHAVFVEVVGGSLEELRRFPERAGQATVRENLLLLLEMISAGEERSSPLMASMSSDKELAESFARYVQAQDLEGFDPATPLMATAAYLLAEQRLGRVRKDIDPAEAAAVVVAVPLARGLERVLSPDSSIPSGIHGPTAPITTAVDILARGLAP